MTGNRLLVKKYYNMDKLKLVLVLKLILNLKALLVLQLVGKTNFYINCQHINKNTNNNDNKILYYCNHEFKMNPILCPSIHNNTYSHIHKCTYIFTNLYQKCILTPIYNPLSKTCPVLFFLSLYDSTGVHIIGIL